MIEATGFEARTIHRLLEVDPRTGGFRRGPDHLLECDLLVIDEASMVDVPLMHGKRSSAALLPLRRTDVLGRPGSGVFELPLWLTLSTTRRVSCGGSSC